MTEQELQTIETRLQTFNTTYPWLNETIVQLVGEIRRMQQRLEELNFDMAQAASHDDEVGP